MEEHGHAFPLSPGLIPIVYFQNVEKVFLGKPFTTCIETSAINSYAKWVSSIYGSYHIVQRTLVAETVARNESLLGLNFVKSSKVSMTLTRPSL